MLKVPLTDSEEVRVRFRREAAAMAGLRHRAIPAVLEAGEVDGRPFLLLERVGGRTLEARLRDAPEGLAEAELWTLARGLASALTEVHRRGFLHRDIKPANVLLRDDGTPFLIDFGLTAQVTAPAPAGETDAEQVGTLAYAAPEQLGLLDRAVDARADLYGLGAVLFECATGKPVTDLRAASDALWRQLSLPAPSVSKLRPQLSPALGQVVEALLARDPDDRYASAARLLADLERLHALARVAPDSGAARAPVELELGSAFEAGGQGEGLAAREGEKLLLAAAWSEAKRKGLRAALVEAPTGLGKTALLRTLARQVESEGHVVLMAACDREQDEPLAPLRRAVDGYLARAQRLPQALRVRHQEYLRQALSSDEAGLLKRFSPRLAALLGEVAEPVSVRREAFHEAVCRFLERLASAAGGLLLALDEAHELEEASLHVLRTFVAGAPESTPAFLLAAVQPSAEAKSSEAFVAAVAPLSLRRVELLPLNRDELTRMLVDALGSEVAPDLVEQLLAHTGGSPLAARHYLSALVDEGYLQPHDGRWTFTARSGASIPTSMVELLGRAVERLSPPVRRVLEQAAVLGNRFSLEVLGKASELGESAARMAVEEGLGARLLVASQGGLELVHERVRGQLLAGLPPSRLMQLHAQAARALEPGAAEDPSRLFALARHLAAAGSAVDPRHTYELNRAAGLRALESWAEVDAYGYLRAAVVAAQSAGLEPDVEVYEGLGDAAGRVGKFEESLAHLSSALERSREPWRRALIRCRRARAYGQHNGDFGQAWADAFEAFAELGVRISGKSPWGWAVTVLQWLFGMLLSLFPPRSPERLPTAQRERFRVLGELYERAGPMAYRNNEIGVMVQFGLRSMYAGQRLGRSRNLARCTAHFGIAMGMAGRAGAARRWTERGIALARELNDPSTAAYAMLCRSWSLHFAGAMVEAERSSLECLEKHRHWLEAEDYLRGCSDLSWNYLIRGCAREAVLWSERAEALVRQQGWDERDEQLRYLHLPSAALAMLGRRREAETSLQTLVARGASESGHDSVFRAQLLNQRLMVAVELGELGAPLEKALADSEAFIAATSGGASHIRHLHVYRGYALLALLGPAGSGGAFEASRRLRQEAFEREVARLRRVAKVPILRGHLAVLESALGIARGRLGRVEACLARALRLGETCASPWLLFEVARQRARLLRAQGNETAARWQAQQANALAIEQGWGLRAARLRAEFDLELVVGGAGLEASRGSSGRGARAALQAQRKLDALVDIHQACARVIEPAEQAVVVLQRSVRLLGVERGILFSIDEQELPTPWLACDAEGRRTIEGLRFSSRVIEAVRVGRRSVILNGAEDAATLGSQSAVQQNLRSVGAAPLFSNERLVGVLYFDTRLAAGVLTESDLDVVETVAHNLAIRLENARAATLDLQLASERRHRHLADALAAFAARVAQSVDERVICNELLEALQSALGIESGAVVLASPAGARLVANRPSSAPPDPADLGWEQAVKLVAGPGRESLPQVVPVGPGFGRRFGLGLGAGLLASLFTGRGIEGFVVLVGRSTAPGAADAEVLRAFVGQAALALELARSFAQVRTLAVKDELTGLLNRRGFWAAANEELARCARRYAQVGLIVLDVDHFKQVNDSHGHAMGDAVLRHVARYLAQALREGDVLGRIGGEEFAVLVSNAGARESVLQVAERLRQAIERAPLLLDSGALLRVTVSAGACSAPAPNQLELLLRRADEALYEAKRAGRNRCASVNAPSLAETSKPA